MSSTPPDPSRPLSRQISGLPPFSYQSSVDRPLSSLSAASSQSQPSRADQVVYRVYLKTVGALVDARLTHHGDGKGGDLKKDKWFNLSLPDVELHKAELQVFRTVSAIPPQPGPSSDSCGIPPLLIAFILDTSDIPNGQALMWNKHGRKVTIDMNSLGATTAKGKEREARTGIILERWTFRATTPPTNSPSTSQDAPHTAYRMGIIHFRAVYALLRLMPAYRLFRRLRRNKNGLRYGVKLWSPEGFHNSSEGLTEAWDTMEKGLLGVQVGLDQVALHDHIPMERIGTHSLPPLELFGTQYTLSAEYRPNIDFFVENMEMVLSEKFVDMDEDWFTPTVARHRMEAEARDVPMPVRAETRSKRISPPSAAPSSQSPIPVRQQAAFYGSVGSGSSTSRPSAHRLSSKQQLGTHQRAKPDAGSVGTDKWGALGEGLPFASTGTAFAPNETRSQDPPSPGIGQSESGRNTSTRRLSAHSIQPFGASPSTSYLRSTPPGSAAPGYPGQTTRPGSLLGRTSSFLSQSGRSFTHAQLANMHAASGSPPVPVVISGYQVPGSSPPSESPISPSSLSFSKQPILRNLSGRPQYMISSTSSPFLPGSLEKDPPGSTLSLPAPQIIKRYSSSLSQRQSRPLGTSQGSSGEGTSLPGSAGTPSYSLLRRTSTRLSQESGLRLSQEGAPSPVPGPDDADIQAFLKTMDNLPQPPSLAAQLAQTSRSYLPSTSSSLSVPSVSPSAGAVQPLSSGSPRSDRPLRAAVTKAQIDDTLRQMAGSFNLSTGKIAESTSGSAISLSQPSALLRPGPGSSVGLLTASRPVSAPRRVTPTSVDVQSRPLYRRQISGGSPLATQSPIAANPLPGVVPVSTPAPQSTAGSVLKVSSKTHGLTTARSLPGAGSAALAQDVPVPPTSVGLGGPSIMGMLSPQTTGGTSSATDSTRASSRRGPVLLRGGFGDQRPVKASASSSPSHSPIRDYQRLGIGTASNRVVAPGHGERQAEEELGAWTRSPRYRPIHVRNEAVPDENRTSGSTRPGPGPRRASSSLGAEAANDQLNPPARGRDPGRRERVGGEGEGAALSETPFAEDKETGRGPGPVIGDW